MDFLTLTYIYSIVTISVGLYLLTITLPDILSEGNVKNGLREYRKFFLASAISLYALGVIIVAVMISRFFLEREIFRDFAGIMLLCLSTGYLISAYAKRKQYTFNFSEQSKKVHEAIEKMEEEEAASVAEKVREMRDEK